MWSTPVEPAHAHDIPADVRVLAFVKPEDRQLQLLVRVPLAAMNEVDMPLRGPGYLDLARADAALRTAAELWLADNLSVYEDGRPLPRAQVLATRVSLASDRSFGSWREALAHLRSAPIPADTELPWKAQHFDVLLAYPVRSAEGPFSIEPRLARMGLKVVTALRFLPARPPGAAGSDGEPAERAFEWHGNPGLVHLDPRWHQAAWRFVQQGFGHILEGADHLLFLACLVLPLRKWRPLVVMATAFTLGHSITLAAAALGAAPEGAWFAPLVETLIAASIVLMAVENIFGAVAHGAGGAQAGGAAIDPAAEREARAAARRWRLAFVFGLVHGFGFALALRESLQFAGSHLAAALAAFNLGVELGQLAVLTLAVPVLGALLERADARTRRIAIVVLSALIAHSGWHWASERFAVLARFPLPGVGAGEMAGALRWAMAAVVLGLVLWAADRPVRRWMRTG